MQDSNKNIDNLNNNAENRPLFYGKEEFEFLNELSEELQDTVAKQYVVYYEIDADKTKYHPLYKEAVNKVWKPPLKIFCRIQYEEPEQKTGAFGGDRRYRLEVMLQKSILNKLNVEIITGAFFKWGSKFYEITTVSEPQIFAGIPEFSYSILCKCLSARMGVFNPDDDSINYNLNENKTV